MDTTIKIRKNGPYLVTGVCKVTDHEGNAIEVKENFVLCRCGASTNKPFCDGTHNKVNFNDEA
ncbi:MAG: CDGSH iron-sulfur domain-containing protein [Gemmatimonadota bacterium]|nr:CDGSH iron-sulfur domain-containing protein [Gemmatimonadota bacterium]